MATRTKTLAVQEPTGRMLTAQVERIGDVVRVRTEPIHATIEDGTNNTPDGRLVFEISPKGYPEAIEKLEAYLEALMLKELGREDINPGDKPRPNNRRAKAEPVSESSRDDKGEDDSPVDSGRDREEPTPRPRKRRKPKTDVAEESYPGLGESGESGDETLPESR